MRTTGNIHGIFLQGRPLYFLFLQLRQYLKPKSHISQQVSRHGLRLNKYSILAHIYFFFNSFALPKGLVFTSLLSPVFFYYQIINKRSTWLPGFLILLSVFDCIHLYHGVDLRSFILSNGFFITTYFAVVSFYHFINGYPHLGRLMRQLVTTNFILTLVAIPFFFLPPPYIDWFWWINHAAPSRYEFPRLKLLTYEASYYSLIYVPVFFYYGLKLITNQLRNHKIQMALVVFLPLLLSLSFGVLGATALTVLLLTLSRWRRLMLQKRTLVSIGFLGLLILGLALAAYYFPDNYLSKRFASILDGNDTSARGRTSDSFQIAWMLASKNNVWFGCGLGQVKIQIDDLVREHLGYWGSYTRYDIPNAMGETLAIFGTFGVIIRLALEWYLFFKTKVKTNYYRLALFIFAFIYQFTGSFITNIAEYTIWALAFSKVFEQFNVKQSQT